MNTQVWGPILVHVLGIVKEKLGLDCLCKILQILSVTAFEKTLILEGFSAYKDEFLEADLHI